MLANQDIDRFGSSRQAEYFDIKSAGLLGQGGVSLGHCPYSGLPLRLDADSPLITIAGSGSGKGRDVLLYSALYKGSMLVNDPKGEIAAITGNHHKKSGKKVRYINPAGLHTDYPWLLGMHRVNPLDILTPDSPTLTADCKLIMEMLIKLTGGKSEFFEQRARQWCASLLKWLVLTLGNVTLPEFYTFLNLIEADPYQWEELCNKEFKHFPSDDIQRTAGEMLYKRERAAGEFSGIMGTIFQNLSFLDDPSLTQCLSNPDFSLSALGEPEKTVIFLIVPADYVGVWSSLIRLIIGVGMSYKQRRPGQRVLFLVDEASQLGKFELLQRAFTFGRGAGLRTWGVFQDVGQILEHYGQAGVSTFLGSSQVRQFFGVRDYTSAALISNMLGNQTLSYDDIGQQDEARKARWHVLNTFLTGDDPFQAAMDAAHFARASTRKTKMSRPLLSPDEILQMPEDKQILFISGINCPPILADRKPYYRAKEMRGAFLPSPFHPAG